MQAHTPQSHLLLTHWYNRITDFTMQQLVDMTLNEILTLHKLDATIRQIVRRSPMQTYNSVDTAQYVYASLRSTW